MKKNGKPEKSVLVDTNFLIAFSDRNHKYSGNAHGYYKHFKDERIKMYVSTLTLAEYQTGLDDTQRIEDNLPMKDFQILDFRPIHTIKSGAYAKVYFKNRRKDNGVMHRDRKCIPIDAMLLAQASVESQITHFTTADGKCKKPFDKIVSELGDQGFKILDIKINHSTFFSLPLSIFDNQ